MARYVAFLRAINVTGRFIKMDVLRAVFEALGFDNVATYIQSGNVLFDAAVSDPTELETEIEAGLQSAFGFEVPTFVRSEDELAELMNFRPFDEAEIATGATFYIPFLKSAPAEDAAEKLCAWSSSIDEFVFFHKQLLWLWRRDNGEIKFTTARVERLLKMPATRRNSTSVNKLMQKHFAGA